MRFALPLFLLLVPVLVVSSILLWRHARRRAQQKMALFGPLNRQASILRSLDPAARRRKAVLFAAALCLLAVTAARPVWGPRPDAADQTGSEFFIVLDVSKSMLVRDVTPNRLEAVKTALADWLKTRHGDRIGLIVMAGDAFVQAPLTNDYTALREVLSQTGPASISKGGTNIPMAVQVAVKALDAGDVKRKVVVLVSDGENLEGEVAAAIQEASVAHKITFFTMGVGTLEGGKVPEKDAKPDFTKPPKAFVRDDYGVTAHSRLDERSLRAIAAMGGGRYFHFTPDGETWDSLYSQALATLARRTETFNLQQYDDLYQIPLVLVIALLLWEMMLSTRKKHPEKARSIVSLPEPATAPPATAMSRKPNRNARRRKAVATLIVTGLLGALSSTGHLHAADSALVRLVTQSGELIAQGKATEAAELLRAAAQKDPNDYYVVYNLGIASYAAGQWQDAVDAFAEATSSPEKRVRAQALVQMGNAQYQLGKTLLKTGNRMGASVAWERSVETYESALAVKSSSTTEHNLQVARERLESVLMNLADSFISNAEKSKSTESKINELTKAVSSLERVTQLNPKNKDAEQKLEDTRKKLAEQLRDQARELRAKAEQVNPEKDKEGKEQEKLNTAANERYEQAREQAPKDKELAQEHDAFRNQVANALTDKAEAKVQQAMQPPAKPEKGPNQGEVKKRQNTLNDALAKVDKALAFEETNQRAQNLKAEVMKQLEAAHMEYADMAKASGDKQAQTQPESAAGNFTEAVQNYQKALEINPENAGAKEKLAQSESALAKALTESGKKEMAQASGEKPPQKGKGKDNKPAAPAEPAAEMRENIGHLEKAAQNFAQADALRPGENEAQALQQQALDQLDSLRAALDQMQNQNKGPGQKPGPGEPAQVAGEPMPGEPAEQPAQQASNLTPMKPVLSFSEIRSADKSEGQFKDLKQNQKVRDW
jgi:Ca-activated chloride channel family protein